MSGSDQKPRILIAAPEASYLPEGMGPSAERFSARAGDLGDLTAALIHALHQEGADIHVALPDYRRLFRRSAAASQKTPAGPRRYSSANRIHLAKDRAFFYLNRIYSDQPWENVRLAVAFQRDLINTIIPRVRPDLIHCFDWMTGLVPAMARQFGIPCLFSLVNNYTAKCTLAVLEDRGIDSASFWQQLYFDYFPSTYEETRPANPVDFLLSGVFAAHYVNLVRPGFMDELDQHPNASEMEALRRELNSKRQAGCASEILNAPGPTYHPATDRHLTATFCPRTQAQGKRTNKASLQELLGLRPEPGVPMIACSLGSRPGPAVMVKVSEFLEMMASGCIGQPVQVVFLADGVDLRSLIAILPKSRLTGEIATVRTSDRLMRQVCSAADFMLVPARVDASGQTQMIAMLYGALPVLSQKDARISVITALEPAAGSGFIFDHRDPNGLTSAIDAAMAFYRQKPAVRQQQIGRVMREAALTLDYHATARQYICLYEDMLKRPLILPQAGRLIELRRCPLPQRELRAHAT